MLLVVIGVTIVVDVSLTYFTWEEAFGLKFSAISGVITLRNSPRIQPYYILSIITLINQSFIFYIVIILPLSTVTAVSYLGVLP